MGGRRGLSKPKPLFSEVRSQIPRRDILQTGILGGVAAAIAPALSAGRVFAAEVPKPLPIPAFEFEEATVSDLESRMSAGQISAATLSQAFLERIQDVDKNGPRLNSVIEVNPDALGSAEALDKERKEKGVRGPLHGIPVLLKDNIDTADRMQTTAGSLALVGDPPALDATVAARLRQAGAVILGKTNLSEWANFRSSRSTSGWSGRGGLTRNPYVLDRNPCGSSSGSAAAA